jgi:BASS family bile acid:Na+ symporter
MNLLLNAAAVGLAASGLLAAWLDFPQLANQLWAVATGVLAIRISRSSQWKTFSFACWVIAVVFQAFSRPQVFLDWPIGAAPSFVVPLIQIIMFGMGTTLLWDDFRRVFKTPQSVAVGISLQFLVMPIVGWGLARLFGFPPEIAAGVVLIGACPGGVASNVIAYLARGDVALSVSLTACSTFLSPLMTPLAMGLLVGNQIDISWTKMMWSIVEITIVPIVLGILVSYLFQWLRWSRERLERCMSSLAMLAICIVIGIIVSQSRDDLLNVGISLAIVAVLHNAIGYAAGYYGARICRLDEMACRTVSIEVGMQNGGMATALAISVLNSPPAALAGAIFGPWMSISGSVLASWWRKRAPVPWGSDPKDPTDQIDSEPREHSAASVPVL